MKKLYTFLILTFVIFVFTQCSSKNELLTSEKIVSQIELINGWSKSKVNRPNMYLFKMKRNSGFASIAISKQIKLLFGKFKNVDFKKAENLLTEYSENEIKDQFKHWEEKDNRAIPKLVKIKKIQLGKYDALHFGTEYNMNGRILSVDYKILLGNDGWILIGCSYPKLDKDKYQTEFNSILKSIGVKK